MANPTAVDSEKIMDYSGLTFRVAGLEIGTTPVLQAQGANIADHAAPTAYTAHASGGVTVTSNAATDLDTTAAALKTLRDEVATVVTKLNAVITALEDAGILADA
jgi:hypothetical protein